MIARFLCLGILFANLSSILLAQTEENGFGRHKQMYAVPAPGKITIDGKLDDWDLSGGIDMYVMAATKDMQGARFAVMYDKNALYLGGIVRDPSPMMNRHSPEAEGYRAWDADACQFRAMLDPTRGYPIQDSQYAAQTNNQQLVHMLLWYYTDRHEANLQANRTMRYEDLPGAGKFGVMPKESFQAVYHLADDKRGYTFEYRIPWKTLVGDKTPPRGGDVVAATMQINWSGADGLKTSGYAGWGYDLLAFPGVAYQDTGCWGKLIFAKQGHLRRELVEEGVPPQKPLPLNFTYDVPEESDVTVALFNSQNEVVRALDSQAHRPAGPVTEQWDGLDELGRPLPAGNYFWKGLYHQPLTTKYVLSVHNSGQPAWKTDDGTGAWGGDQGIPRAVCAAGHGMVLVWGDAEAGSGIIRTDGEGKKQWGILRPAYHVATDGERIFAAGGGYYPSGPVSLFALKDGQKLTFGNGAEATQPPAGSSGETNAVTGLAYHDGKLYLAFEGRNLIAIYDAKQGELKQTWPVPAPGALAIRPDGSLLSVSGTSVVNVQAGKVTPLLTTHLDEPSGIAVDAAGTIYVANHGKLQNVSVFSAAGEFQRSIGKPGGRPDVGRYDPAGMLKPTGLAIDEQSRLWVAEQADSPKRVSVWTTATGTLAREFFGAGHYSAQICMDPARPDEVFCDGTIWKVDFNAKTNYPYSTWYKPKNADSPGLISTHLAGLRVFTAKNGRQYAWGGLDQYYSTVLFIREGDVLKPILSFIYSTLNPIVAKTNPDGGTIVWVDKNDDQIMQADELGPVLTRNDYRGFHWVDADLNLWHGHGDVYRAVRIEPDGRPVYDFSKRDHFVTSPDRMWGGVAVDPDDGSLYLLRGEGAPGPDIGFGRWQPDGKLLWGYRGAIDWKAGGFTLPPQRPGKVWGPMQFLGFAGEFTGYGTYFGCHHIFTRDGLCVGMIFRDPRLGGGLGADVIACENGNGQLVKPKGMNRYFALGGDQDGRVTEIFGLETVKRLSGGELTITDAAAKKVADGMAEYQAKLARTRRLTIVRGKEALAVAQPVEKTVTAVQSFQARAAYDSKNLYVSFVVTSPAELLSGATDPQLLFKGGNCLDIQLATDSHADPQRKSPAPGDLRLLVTRQAGKPVAVLFRPKVKGFNGQPTVLRSPTGQELFDQIVVTDQVSLEYQKTATVDAFRALVTIPLTVLDWKPQPGSTVKMDVGYIFGNATGTKAMTRAYWTNNGLTAGMLNDVPSESRLEPNLWGTATVE